MCFITYVDWLPDLLGQMLFLLFILGCVICWDRCCSCLFFQIQGLAWWYALTDTVLIVLSSEQYQWLCQVNSNIGCIKWTVSVAVSTEQYQWLQRTLFRCFMPDMWTGCMICCDRCSCCIDWLCDLLWLTLFLLFCQVHGLAVILLWQVLFLSFNQICGPVEGFTASDIDPGRQTGVVQSWVGQSTAHGPGGGTGAGAPPGCSAPTHSLHAATYAEGHCWQV